MKVRKFLLLMMSLFILTMALNGQGGIANKSEKRHFRMSLVVDGRHVTEFDLRFLVRSREIIPERDGENFFVPDEILEASWQDSGVRFVGTDFDFTFDNIVLKGYTDSDKIKSDYKIRVDALPLEIRRHVSRLTEKQRRSLKIRTYKDICAVYSLEPLNLVVDGSEMIVDPVTTAQLKLCKRKNR